jgi:hypothetical protein
MIVLIVECAVDVLLKIENLKVGDKWNSEWINLWDKAQREKPEKPSDPIPS